MVWLILVFFGGGETSVYLSQGYSYSVGNMSTKRRPSVEQGIQ